MEIIIYIIFSLFFLEHLILFIGLRKNLPVPAEKSPSKNNDIAFISVIVAARNEEKVIEPCIISLINLDYPKDKYEVILVNDRSNDATGNIMKKYSSFPGSNVKYLYIKDISGKLKGKTNALFNALKIAKGEFIFTTDADIEVKPTWMSEMMKYYLSAGDTRNGDEKTGVVSSYSIMKPDDLNSGVQSLDWIYLLTIAAGSFGLNQPISCVGNNMSYRRAAYDEVGGYENIKFSVTEDFMLLQTIRRKTKWRAKFPVNIKCMNWTLPCSSFMELYRQKKRWTKGGLDASWPGLLAGGLAWIVSVMFLFGWLFAGFKLYILYLVLKLIIDMIFTLPAVNAFKITKVYLYIIPFEIYYAIYVFLAPFIVLFDRKVVWKEQKL